MANNTLTDRQMAKAVEKTLGGVVGPTCGGSRVYPVQSCKHSAKWQSEEGPLYCTPCALRDIDFHSCGIPLRHIASGEVVSGIIEVRDRRIRILSISKKYRGKRR